jgi:hypothetical protein
MQMRATQHGRGKTVRPRPCRDFSGRISNPRSKRCATLPSIRRQSSPEPRQPAGS